MNCGGKHRASQTRRGCDPLPECWLLGDQCDEAMVASIFDLRAWKRENGSVRIERSNHNFAYRAVPPPSSSLDRAVYRRLGTCHFLIAQLAEVRSTDCDSPVIKRASGASSSAD